MYNNKEYANYFKSQRTYHRCFEEFREKWKSYGKAAGRTTLKQTSEEEQRAVGDTIGKVFYERAIRFSFLEFKQGLQETRFAPVDMRAVLGEYFGGPLITTRGWQEEEQGRRKKLLDRSRGYFEENAGGEAATLIWLWKMISEKKYGYQLLMRECMKDEKQAELLVWNVGDTVMRLKELMDKKNEYPSAVLTAEITDSPHCFDRNTAAELLFVHAICYYEDMRLSEDAYQWRKVLT